MTDLDGVLEECQELLSETKALIAIGRQREALIRAYSMVLSHEIYVRDTRTVSDDQILALAEQIKEARAKETKVDA